MLPASVSGCTWAQTRKRISTPLTSSPWMAAPRYSRGPGEVPLINSRGRVILVPSASSVTSRACLTPRPAGIDKPATCISLAMGMLSSNLVLLWYHSPAASYGKKTDGDHLLLGFDAIAQI